MNFSVTEVATPFKNGKTYGDCFRNKGIGIRQNYPYFDTKSGEVITLELALNQCREANGEKPLDYTKDAMAEALWNIQSGGFARDWILENRAGSPSFKSKRRMYADSYVEEVGGEATGLFGPVTLGAMYARWTARAERFRRTLGRGMSLLEEATAGLSEGGVLPGETAFKLYDTYGFPLDLVQDALKEEGLGLDQEGFEAHMRRQREASRQSWRGGAGEEVEVVTGASPFYGETGGQVGDSGWITGSSGGGGVVRAIKYKIFFSSGSEG